MRGKIETRAEELKEQLIQNIKKVNEIQKKMNELNILKSKLQTQIVSTRDKLKELNNLLKIEDKDK